MERVAWGHNPFPRRRRCRAICCRVVVGGASTSWVPGLGSAALGGRISIGGAAVCLLARWPHLTTAPHPGLASGGRVPGGRPADAPFCPRRGLGSWGSVRGGFPVDPRWPGRRWGGNKGLWPLLCPRLLATWCGRAGLPLLLGLATRCLGAVLPVPLRWCLALLGVLLAWPGHPPKSLGALGVPCVVLPPAVGALRVGCLVGLMTGDALFRGVGQAAHAAPDGVLAPCLEVVEVLALKAPHRLSLVGA